jgi:chloramphenicol-sensitive protein RarD
VGLLALSWLSVSGESHFAESSTLTLLLMSSGIVTAIPLLFFAGAARRLRLSTVGFLMYINPTLQFCLALLVFDEPLSEQKLLSFIIWLALGLYSWSAWRGRKPLQPA